MASVTPRRSPRFREASSSVSSPSSTSANGGTSTTTTPTKMATLRSPFQPSNLEALLLAAYPVTLILGSLFSLLNPATRAAPYSATTQSHVHQPAPSYFAQKTNIFNIIFVKKGWFWVTVSYFFFLFTHPSTGPARQPTLTPKRIQGLVRWSFVTLWWFFVTQWFFGPAIIDRGFTLTGGQCELLNAVADGQVDVSDTRRFLTGIACKAVGGKWKGGHDISGHVFLLVLGSMFLLEEVLHVLLTSRGASEKRTIVMDDGAVKSAVVETQGGNVSELGSLAQLDCGVRLVLVVSGLSGWMLLMTAAYFHTWFEKFTGLLVAFSGIFVIYFLPRAIPSLRRIVGLPGV